MKFCPYCGKELLPTYKPLSKGLIITIIAIIVVAIVVIMSISYMVMRQGRDTTPPIIINVQAETTTPWERTTWITWTTNELSTSVVEYGTTISYGLTAIGKGVSTAHEVALSNLSVGTTYHYRVRSTDSAGNTAISDDYSFLTGNETVSLFAISMSAWLDTGSYINATVISTTPTSGGKISDITWQLYNVTAGMVVFPGTGTFMGVEGATLSTSDYLTAGCSISFNQPAAGGSYKIRAIVDEWQIYESATFVVTV